MKILLKIHKKFCHTNRLNETKSVKPSLFVFRFSRLFFCGTGWFVLSESQFPGLKSLRNRSRACVPRLAGRRRRASPVSPTAVSLCEGCKSFAAWRRRARAAGARVSACGGNLLQPRSESCTNFPLGANTRIARVCRLRRPEGRRARAADFPLHPKP